MSQASAMLDTYPADLGQIDRQVMTECIEACFDCSQSCTACADACLSEESVAGLIKCIRSNLDCADVCDATGRIVSRHTGYDANLTRTQLRACVQACRSCGEECAANAHLEHCRLCAQACRRCEQACQELLAALG